MGGGVGEQRYKTAVGNSRLAVPPRPQSHFSRWGKCRQLVGPRVPGARLARIPQIRGGPPLFGPNQSYVSGFFPPLPLLPSNPDETNGGSNKAPVPRPRGTWTNWTPRLGVRESTGRSPPALATISSGGYPPCVCRGRLHDRRGRPGQNVRPNGDGAHVVRPWACV